MAGCEPTNDGGNWGASRNRILTWAAVFGGVGDLLLYLGFGAVGFDAFFLAFVAGAILGFFVGSAIDWFRRLKVQKPRTITISGSALCAGRNTFGLQPISDGDWASNIGRLGFLYPADMPVITPGATTQIDEVRLRPAPGSGLAHAFPSYNSKVKDTYVDPILHCELGAKAGDYSVAAGAVGSVAGTAIGISAGLASCVALGILTFGLALAACAFIVAALAAIGAAAGGAAGSLVGAVIGWIVDELSDFDKLGKTIESNGKCAITITGRWVTDISHEHNEIHDIEAVQVVPCTSDATEPATHLFDLAIATIGRRPTGGQPTIT